MVRNALRKELTELLTGAAESRKPAVRRSRKAEWLYATDLPSLYAGIIPDTLKAALTGAGWVYAQEGDWLQEQYDGLKRSFSSTMTYDSRYEGGFAVSGIQDGRIYYDRGWESSDNKGILFIIDYPESRASVCNDVVTQFFESFTPPQN